MLQMFCLSGRSMPQTRPSSYGLPPSKDAQVPRDLSAAAATPRLPPKAALAIQDEASLESIVAVQRPALIAGFHLNRRYIYCNPAYREWFGLDPQSLIGLRFEEVVGDAVYQIAKPHVQQALAGNDANFEGAFAYNHEPTRHVNVHYSPQRNPSGQVPDPSRRPLGSGA